MPDKIHLRDTRSNYGLVTIGLHWFMLLLIVAVYSCMEFREIFPKGSDPREAMKTLHFMLGLSVLLLVSIRILVRLTSQTPAIEPNPPEWQMQLARLGHFALYFFMLAMPLLGWLILSLEGKPIPFYGWELPPLVNADKGSVEWVEEIHETVGLIGYYLIGLHAAAALLHHYFLRDNTLHRMLKV
jgi:cytochrome b561